MSFLYDSSFVVKFTILTFFLFLFIALSLYVRRVLILLWQKWDKRKFFHIEEDVLTYLDEGGELLDFPRKYRVNSVREHLVTLGLNLNGVEKRRLIDIYKSFGFYDSDLKDLCSGRKKKKSYALRRARILGFKLKNEQWLALFKEKSPVFRWAVMEYLISVKREKAIPWMFSFLTDSRNDRYGIIQHLFCCLADTSRETILTVLNYSEDSLIVEQCLRTFSVYPYMKAEPSIVAQMRSDRSEEAYISAVRALGGVVTPKVLSIFSLSAAHPHWVVRMIIAKSLLKINDEKAYGILKKFSEDVNYYVRLHTIKALLEVREEVQDFIQEISSNKDHPSHQLLLYLLDLELEKEVLE